MPRIESESRLRRILMQSIMWIVLGGTVALAALVNQAKRSALYAPLGEPTQLNGFSISLPKGWKSVHLIEAGVLAEVQEPNLERSVMVIQRRPSFAELLGLGENTNRGPRQDLGAIPMGDRTGHLVGQKVQDHATWEIQDLLTASLAMSDGRTLQIQVIAPALSASRDISEADLDLIRRIAASAKFD